MRLQSNLKVMLAVLILAGSTAGMAQTAPAATKGGWPFIFGGGVSVLNPDYPDYSAGPMLGGKLWLDYLPTFLPKMLNGLGVEAEGTDINYHRSSTQAGVRVDTTGGGAIYRWRHFDRIVPYGKVLFEFGDMDFGTATTGGSYEVTRTVRIFGGGVEYRVWNAIWARADYEYQDWPGFYSYPGHPGASLYPMGGTVGVMYSFRDRGR